MLEFVSYDTRRIVADDIASILQEKLTLGVHHREPQSPASRKEEQGALDLFVDLLRTGGANPDPQDDINVERWRKVLWSVDYYFEELPLASHSQHLFSSRAEPPSDQRRLLEKRCAA